MGAAVRGTSLFKHKRYVRGVKVAVVGYSGGGVNEPARGCAGTMASVNQTGTVKCKIPTKPRYSKRTGNATVQPQSTSGNIRQTGNHEWGKVVKPLHVT